MPVIMFEGPRMPADKKRQLVHMLTEASRTVTGIPQQAFIVLIHENEHDNVGVAGELLTDRIKRQG